MTELAELIKEHSWTKYHKVLFCAQDVADDLASECAPAAPPMPGMADLTWLVGIAIVVTPDSAPGSWRLVRHDHCEVVTVEDEDGQYDMEKSYVSHQDCTILAESGTAR